MNRRMARIAPWRRWSRFALYSWTIRTATAGFVAGMVAGMALATL